MGIEEDTTTGDARTNTPRRILKVRLRQDQVIRLHELRILRGKSIATLLEAILEDYFSREDESADSATHVGVHQFGTTAGVYAAAGNTTQNDD